MEEKGSSKDKLIENIRINLISEEQILPKSTEEKILCCCLNYDLTYSEYKSFDTLKKKVIHAYNNKNEEHEKILQDLFNRTKEILNKDNNSSEITQISTKESENEKNSNKTNIEAYRYTRNNKKINKLFFNYTHFGWLVDADECAFDYLWKNSKGNWIKVTFGLLFLPLIF